MNFRRISILFLIIAISLRAEDGYEMWLRYRPEPDAARRTEYLTYGKAIISADRPILKAAREELSKGLTAMTGSTPTGETQGTSGVFLGTLSDGGAISALANAADLAPLGAEGFVIRSGLWRGQKALIVAGQNDSGVLHGTFRLLRSLQLGESIAAIDIREAEQVQLRMANHWDNPVRGDDGVSIERGYAGDSIFHWNELPGRIDPRYKDYARLLAAMNLNSADINNVNTAKHGLAGWRLVTTAWLPKVAALAGVLRPYGVRMYLSVNFFSPILVDHLPTADPLNPAVQAWWKAKADEIYQAIPDFGGFVVKADSENEPGPYKYGRTHAEGANLLARALAPHGGVVIWRAFVYTEAGDRVTDAYKNFAPLDGKFDSNVVVQIKNGPLDFQIREPVSPLFGAMPKTNQALEFEITQEYTGQDKHLCFLGSEWREILDFDTHAKGAGSTISKLITDNSSGRITGIAAVMNTGSDRNWTGALMAQANTYAFGRLAWNPNTSAEAIARDWVQLTFGRDPKVVATITSMLLSSRRTFEDYTAPLGLGLLTERGNHFEPAPANRVNYTHADARGVGYDRTVATGSGYAGQYHEPWRSRYESVESCPEDLLLFFHHVPYDMRLPSGSTVIQEIYQRHTRGAANSHHYVAEWESLRGHIDDERFNHVLERLKLQAKLADHWSETINGYFQKLSGIPP